MGTQANNRPTLVHPPQPTVVPALSVRDLSIDFHLRTQLSKILHQIPGKRVVVVDQQQHGGAFLLKPDRAKAADSTATERPTHSPAVNIGLK